jgi:hypothetical protein
MNVLYIINLFKLLTLTLIMNLDCFMRSLEVPGLTGLVTIPRDSLLRTREGDPAHISFAYSPERVKADISAYKLKELPNDPRILAQFRRHIENYVNDSCPKDANAFHLSHPKLWNVNMDLLTDLEYTVSFFVIKDER